MRGGSHVLNNLESNIGILELKSEVDGSASNVMNVVGTAPSMGMNVNPNDMNEEVRSKDDIPVEMQPKCVMKNMRCITHDCEVRKNVVTSKVWGWIERKKCFGYKPKKTTKLICVGRGRPSVSVMPVTTNPAAMGIKLRPGGAIIDVENSRTNTSDGRDKIESESLPD